MICHRTGTEFLDWINRRVVFEDGTPRLKTDEEKRGQLQMLLDLRPFMFLQQVDMVIEGGCARDARLGRFVEGEPLGGDLDHYLKQYTPKHVLVFAECCGPYEDDVPEKVRALYPEITWLFPNVGDLFTYMIQDENFFGLVWTLWKEEILGLAR